MFVAKIPNRNSPPCYLLRENRRVDGKVRTTTLANLSHLSINQINAISATLKGETLASVETLFKIERSLPHGHVAAVLGTMRKLGLDTLLDPEPSGHRAAALAMIALRILAPDSKLAMSRMLAGETASSSLGKILGLEQVDDNALYRAMDWLGLRQKRIETALAKRHLADGALVLYDITSVYFEGKKCPLAKHGYNRDGKTGTTQIVIGLVCTDEGCPLSVQVFEGNTADCTTVKEQIEKVKRDFGVKNVVLVGDRGMLTGKLIEESREGADALSYVTALRTEGIKNLLRQGAIDRELFDEENLAEIKSAEYPDDRLVVCMNRYLCEERRKNRRDLLETAKKKLETIKKAVERKTRPLRGEAKIGMKIGDAFAKNPMKKHFVLTITDSSFAWEENRASVQEEELLDGLYVIRTNVPEADVDASTAVSLYKRLAKVERAFRCMKLSDLEIRPVYHYRPDRVRSHVFLCMLSYYVEWHMRKALAPILFEEHDPIGKEAARRDPVEPARPSAATKRKTSRLKTDDGFPLHSFKTLLKDMSTLMLNVVTTMKNGTFTTYTKPTTLQAKAFELLGLSSRELAVGSTQ